MSRGGGIGADAALAFGAARAGASNGGLRTGAASVAATEAGGEASAAVLGRRSGASNGGLCTGAASVPARGAGGGTGGAVLGWRCKLPHCEPRRSRAHTTSAFTTFGTRMRGQGCLSSVSAAQLAGTSPGAIVVVKGA